YQRQLKRLKDHKDSTISFDKDNISVSEISTATKGVRPLGTVNFGNINFDSSTSFIGGLSTQAVMSKKQQQQSDKKKEMKKDVNITKEELLKEIEKMKEREEEFYRHQYDKYHTLPWGD